MAPPIPAIAASRLVTASRDDEAQVLHYLAVKSLAPPESVAAMLGGEPEEAVALLERHADRGLVEHRRLGFRLTDEGRAEVAGLREQELADGGRERLGLAFAGFEALNDRLLVLATEWQVVSLGGEQIPNDHTDEAYDARVIGRLYRLHDEFTSVLEDLAEALPRLAAYRARFEQAVERIREGDHDYVTRPDREAYHTLWFELHEELLQLLGRERQAQS